VARNLEAELSGCPLKAFTVHDKGFVASVGSYSGVAEIGGLTNGSPMAHLRKDAIEWEYEFRPEWTLTPGPRADLSLSSCAMTCSPTPRPSRVAAGRAGEGAPIHALPRAT
jgi:hypothetical protein